MSAASSWPLGIVAPSREASLPERDSKSPPGLNFDPFPRPKGRIPGALRPKFVLQTFKTQNDARGDQGHTARQIHLVTDCKSPKLPNLPTACERKRHRFPTTNRAFRAVTPIWDDYRGNSRAKSPDPHTFSCTTPSGAPLCTPFAEP